MNMQYIDTELSVVYQQLKNSSSGSQNNFQRQLLFILAGISWAIESQKSFRY